MFYRAILRDVFQKYYHFSHNFFAASDAVLEIKKFPVEMLFLGVVGGGVFSTYAILHRHT